MRADNHGRMRVGVVVALASCVAIGAAAVVTGAVLATDYRPTHSVSFSLPDGAGEADRWDDVNAAAVVLSLLASAVLLVVVTMRSVGGLRVAGPWGRASVIAITGALVALGAAVVALLTRSLVQWDQLALWSVVAGHDVDGYFAALRDDVRFVIVGDAEVSRSQYTAALVAHLAAPAVSLVGAGVAGWASLRQEPAAADSSTQNSRSSLDWMPRSSS